MFLEGLELHGKDWEKIAALVKSRTVLQTRTHAQKVFLKIDKAMQNTYHMAEGSTPNMRTVQVHSDQH